VVKAVDGSTALLVHERLSAASSCMCCCDWYPNLLCAAYACVLFQLYLMTRALEFITPDLSRLSLGSILADIKASMMDEVDFTKVNCLLNAADKQQ